MGNITCGFDLELVTNVEPSEDWYPKFVHPVLFHFEFNFKDWVVSRGESNELHDGQVICPFVVKFGEV